MVAVLGLCGAKGIGKSTLARLLEQEPCLGRVERRPMAGPWKQLCVELLNLDPDAVYGDDAAKEALSPYRWCDLPHYSPEKYPEHSPLAFLTVREFLQQGATEIFRKLDPDIWLKHHLRSLAREKVLDLVIVDDARFVNEAQALQTHSGGGLVIQLAGSSHSSSHSGQGHSSETSLRGFPFDATLDLTGQSPAQSLQALLALLPPAWKKG